MNSGHLFLKRGIGDTFSPLAELKNEGHARHRTSSQHIRVVVLTLRLLVVPRRKRLGNRMCQMLGSFFIYFSSIHVIQLETRLTLIFRLKARFRY
jgi:hypothetical protein